MGEEWGSGEVRWSGGLEEEWVSGEVRWSGAVELGVVIYSKAMECEEDEVFERIY